MCKLDFEKALDNLNWHSILFIMKTRGFPMKWIEWIKAIITSNKVVVLINGKAGNRSSCGRNVR